MKVKAWIGAIGLLVVAAMPVVTAGPGLLADTMNGSNWTRASDLTVSKAQCTRYQGVVSSCSIQYSGIVRSEIMPELDYFVYGSWAREQVVLLRSTTNPALVTTVQGIRDLKARQGTLAAWAGLWFVLIAWVAVLALTRRSTRTPRMAEPDSPAAIAPAPVFATAAAAPGFQPAGAAPVFGRRGR